jgi:hypothetical protein
VRWIHVGSLLVLVWGLGGWFAMSLVRGGLHAIDGLAIFLIWVVIISVPILLVRWVPRPVRRSTGRCSPTWEGSTAGLARATVATPGVVVAVEYRDHDGRVIARQTEVRSATAPPAVPVPGRFEMVRPLGVPGQGRVRGGTAMISAPGAPSRPAEGEYDASRTREG